MRCNVMNGNYLPQYQTHNPVRVRGVERVLGWDLVSSCAKHIGKQCNP